MRTVRTLLVLAGVAAGGCSGFSTYTAKTLPPGQISATATVLAVADPDSNDRGINWIPELAVRRGLARNAEVGMRFLGTYNEVDLKLRLFAGRHLHLAVAPGGGYAFELEGEGTATGSIAALATVDTGQSTALLAGARVGRLYELDGGDGDIRAAFVGVEMAGETFVLRPCVEAVSTPDYEIVALALQIGGPP